MVFASVAVMWAVGGESAERGYEWDELRYHGAVTYTIREYTPPWLRRHVYPIHRVRNYANSKQQSGLMHHLMNRQDSGNRILSEAIWEEPLI